MSDFQEDLVPSYVVASTTSNSASALICIVTIFCAFLIGLSYANKHSGLDAYMHAKFPTTLLISNEFHRRPLKKTEISIPAASQDTKSRLPIESDVRPKLDEESNGPFTSQPSDSRDRDKSNIARHETTEQNTSSDNFQGQKNMASSENDYIAEGQLVAVEQRITGVTRSGAEVETPMSPYSPRTGLPQVLASAFPANSAKEEAQLVDMPIRLATRYVESDNDTVTSEDAHPYPSPIPDYNTTVAISVECNAQADAMATKRRRRRPRRRKTSQSLSGTIAMAGDGIHFQQPTPRPSPNANVNLYRPTGSHVNPPPGYPQIQFHPQMDYRMTPRPFPIPEPNGIHFHTFTTIAGTQMNVHPSHPVSPPLRAPSAMTTFSDNHYPAMAPNYAAFQHASGIGATNAPRKTPSTPWSPFASGLNIDLGSQIRTPNGKHPGQFHQRSSSTGSFFQHNSGKYNLNGNFDPLLSIKEDNVHKGYGQGSSASLFSNPNPLSTSSPTSPTQPMFEFSWMPTAQMPERGGQTTNHGELYSSQQFSLFEKHLAFSSAEDL